MKRKFLTYANIALGSLSMLFAGCHSQKNATKTPEIIEPEDPPAQQIDRDHIMKKYGVPHADFEPAVCKYGGPPEAYVK
jgi:hypothetical protein